MAGILSISNQLIGKNHLSWQLKRKKPIQVHQVFIAILVEMIQYLHKRTHIGIWKGREYFLCAFYRY